MSHWDYSQIGFSGNEQNEDSIMRLLECLGVDFNTHYGSEVGISRLEFNPDHIGNYDFPNYGKNGVFPPDEIYSIVNKLFGDTCIYYESENGNSISDSYFRVEYSYYPVEKKLYYLNVEYSFGDNTVFCEDVYDYLHDEIETEAKKRDIPVVWENYCPSGRKFEILVDKLIENHGGLSGLGTERDEYPIKDYKVTDRTIKKVIKNAMEKGYNDIVDLVTEAFAINS